MALALRDNLHFSMLLSRCSNLVQRQDVGLLGKLPNRSYRAHREQPVERDFQNVSAFFF